MSFNDSDSQSNNKIDDDSDSENIKSVTSNLDDSDELPEDDIDDNDNLETELDDDLNSDDELQSDIEDELQSDDDSVSESLENTEFEKNYESESQNNIKIYTTTNEPDKRISRQVITKYELTRIIGIRVQQFQRGAKPLVEFDNTMSYEDIVMKEIAEHKSPFKIKRPLPNNVFEEFMISELRLIT